MGATEKLLFEHIANAQKVVSQHIIQTPGGLLKSTFEVVGEQIFIKLENQQITGSFKIRGAINAISNLTSEQKSWCRSIIYRKPWKRPRLCC